MQLQDFAQEMDRRIAQHDLLCHPFYRAWSAGELTSEDLRSYSADYYHHVAAFPTYLSALHSRLSDGHLRRTVLANLAAEEIEGVPHSELWLDFAEAMGNDRDAVRTQTPSPETAALIESFRQIAREGSVASTLAAFYAYESQVPRVAEFKEHGLRDLYGASEKACRYFNLHKTADLHHSRIWRDLLQQEVVSDSENAGAALYSAEKTALALWKVLDGMENRRTVPAA